MNNKVYIESDGNEIQRLILILLEKQKGEFKYYISERLMDIFQVSCDKKTIKYGNTDVIELKWNAYNIKIKALIVIYNKIYGCSCYRICKVKSSKDTISFSKTLIDNSTIMFCLKEEEHTKAWYD